ncbi:type III secretory pathway component EscV [Hymenobacter sp. UYAg731]
MTSKGYFTLTGIFIALYILSSFGVIAGLPDWLHQLCTLIFAAAAFLGVRQKKKEELNK